LVADQANSDLAPSTRDWILYGEKVIVPDHLTFGASRWLKP
jgi:hypothetical protein